MGALQSIPEELTEAARVDGGGAVADLPARDAAAAARRDVAAPDRVVRVQLQQLQQHLPADRRRADAAEPADRGLDRHPDQLHVQARVRDRQGPGLRPRERGLDHHLLHRRDDLRRRRSRARRHWRTSIERADSSRSTRVRAPRSGARPAEAPSLGDTWWRHLVGIIAVAFALFPVWFLALGRVQPRGLGLGHELLPAPPHAWTTSAGSCATTCSTSRPRATSTRTSCAGSLNTIIDRVGHRDRDRASSARSPPTRSAASASGAGAWGCCALLLIQMFPQLLLVVAIYLIVLQRRRRSSRRSA